MSTQIIVRYAEIGLKSGNRILFEQKLMNNIQACFKQNNIKQKAITRPYGRILISSEYKGNILNTIFGIASYSFAINKGNDFEKIKQQALELVKNKLNPKKSFRISCQRTDKSFPMTSNKFEIELGAFIQEKTKAKVSLKQFDINLCAEIIKGEVYLFLEKHKGPGGLPVGISGKIFCLIEDKASLLAAILMLKRGCHIIPIAIKQTSIALLEKY